MFCYTKQIIADGSPSFYRSHKHLEGTLLRVLHTDLFLEFPVSMILDSKTFSQNLMPFREPASCCTMYDSHLHYTFGQ